MTRPPDVIVVLDGTQLQAEPAKLNIPVVGVVDTDVSAQDIEAALSEALQEGGHGE